MKDTFHGFPVLRRVERALPGSEAYNRLTRAAADWRIFALTSLGSRSDENVARELEIERDHGVVIAINPRA